MSSFKKFSLKKGILLGSLALFLGGCVTTGGKNLDISHLSKGKSTKAEVINALGEPDQEVTVGDGRSICTWVSIKKSENLILGALITKGVDSTSQEQANSVTGQETSTVQITFTTDGIVDQISTSKTGHL